MKPGRELDALIAEKVFGFKKVGENNWSHDNQYFELQNTTTIQSRGFFAALIPNYSTDIAAAWEVATALKNRDMNFFSVNFTRFKDTEFEALVHDKIGQPIASSYGDSAAHAICLAALKAIGHKI